MSQNVIAKKARKHLKEAYPEFQNAFQKIKLIQLEPRENIEPFEALARSIIYQQLSGKAAGTIHKRFLELFTANVRSKKHPKPEDILKMSSDKMRSAGVSLNKQKALLDLSQKTLDGVVPTRKKAEDLSNEDLIARLTEVHGIGEWTVQMMLLFYLGRTDIWPTKDLGVQNGHRILLNKKKNIVPLKLLKWGEPLAPYRSYAALYLWQLADLDKIKK